MRNFLIYLILFHLLGTTFLFFLIICKRIKIDDDEIVLFTFIFASKFVYVATAVYRPNSTEAIDELVPSLLIFTISIFLPIVIGP
ncbi:hypothetical protein B5X24_HaOG206866 [Helicoverpa armigera]|uniref:Uncharacterized protein n=1 Tax=Helicoverpa armigera TaxID=29058 RepID=A0A2W1BMX1_HELAM|nr:hypothetical protein B5X24_HaOG206866 [Helicoverpa armigera]